MDAYIIILTLLGVVILLTAWLPMVLRELPMSLPIFCIVIGALFSWSPVAPFAVNPLENRYLTEHLTEFVVIVSLMGAGLKLDRPFGRVNWRTVWRLLGIAMPLTIAAIAFLGAWMLALPLASAVLLGAVLAPTDPVLASDIQVGPPKTGEEDEVRFSLTAEAGLNDGLSFPFVYLAIGLAAVADRGYGDILWTWFTVDVAWRLVAGLLVGWLTGRVLAYLTFRLPQRASLSRTGEGLVALGITCLCYGLTELVHGYGFLAVFVAAITLRSVERQHSYHKSLHDFAEQIERLLMMVLIVCFGMILGDGRIFAAISWEIVLVAVISIFLIRPLFGWISLIGLPNRASEKAVISFFGIRGLGSFYYLAFATGQVSFGTEPTLWITVFLIVLMSIVVHGVAATPVMRRMDRNRWNTELAEKR
ncbi:cation:proton antiporter [Pseudorhizobium pelagicum]|uniref:Cation transporter n=1 Tax=Pseudorhizobium pelagicum TaxID=1509405 RepID=A0A922P3N7_9HYPH|nr:sodium:proton antiporter [Pseudorhizobium pelagicum]KEQ05204.1 cation transporter [Pseudorhizobium pelagicum]KEQ07951.1 cation transporter [Pseudorhizobium pelagicum]